MTRTKNEVLNDLKNLKINACLTAEQIDNFGKQGNAGSNVIHSVNQMSQAIIDSLLHLIGAMDNTDLLSGILLIQIALMKSLMREPRDKNEAIMMQSASIWGMSFSVVERCLHHDERFIKLLVEYTEIN